MEHKWRSPAFATSPILPAIAGAFAIGIFVIDTVTPLGMAVAVLYVIIVLMAASFYHSRGILLVSSGCMALTVLSYLLSHGSTYSSEALVRCLMSLSAIGITTVLALKYQSADMALRERARLLDLTHDTVFVRDMNNVITYWNRGAEELYGWKGEEAVGKVSHQLLRTVFPSQLKEIMAQLLATGRWDGELVQMKRDGTPVVVASRWSVQRDERGTPRAIMETNNDVTERKRAEEALHQVRADLAHVTRVATLGELTASIAHELNQPLAAVVAGGNAGLRWLAAEPPDLEAARRSIERMIRDGRRASEVIDRIRAMVRKSPPKKDWLDVNEAIADVIALTRSEVQRNEVALRIDLANGLPSVLGDRVQLQQVMLNLIVNAIEAMNSVNAGARNLLVSTSKAEPHAVLVAVRDSGMGLDRETLDRLFDAFYTTKSHGMGMGLAISRSIVEAHGGRLWATPNAPQGAVFQFTLSVDAEAVSPLRQTESAS